MIRHQVYFDTLGSLKEESASWRSVFAGLSVLRLVDSCVDCGSGVNHANWAQLHSVRTAIETVSEGDPVRGVLTQVLDEVTKRGAIDETVCTGLLAYGRALDYEASWGMATDVFATVAQVARPEKYPRLAVEANIAVGGAARRNGDWETSARAYSQAAYIADTFGDRAGVLTVQVGIANTYMAKGNLPQAESILDDVLLQAREYELSDVQAVALHSRAALATTRGKPAEGVKLAYEALNLTTNGASRDAVLADIAGCFVELGMRDAARDAYMIVAATSQNKWVCRQATINLMELASLDGMEEQFDQYANRLRAESLDPYLRAHFLLLLGEGLYRLNRDAQATEILEEAVAFASVNQIHDVSFQADGALVAHRSKTSKRSREIVSGASDPHVHGDVAEVVDALSSLREAAFAS
jgi:thioredoxin-like negative regulator of GroEL